MMKALRSGSWVTAQRVNVYSTMLLAVTVLLVGYVFVTSTGGLDYKGRPLGTDYSNVYAAGTFARERVPAHAYVPELQHAREQAIFGTATPFYGWHYPPLFLMLAGVLALLPYLASLLLWQAATFALYLRSMWAILPQRAALLAAAAYPAVMVNITHGHNGFLTAALLGGALVLLKPRPLLAGVLIGLLAYKPQFGLLIPLALMAGGYWRSFASAAATVVGLCLLATMLYGYGVWDAFVHSFAFTQQVVLEQGDTGFHKMQSLFAAVRLVGGSVEGAWLMQYLAWAVLAVSLVALWRSRADDEIKYAGLIIASLLAAPYSLDYDLMLLAPAIAFMAAHGLRKKKARRKEAFAAYEISLLVFAWSVPLYARAFAEATHFPIGCWMLLVMYALVMQHMPRATAAAKKKPRR